MSQIDDLLQLSALARIRAGRAIEKLARVDQRISHVQAQLSDLVSSSVRRAEIAQAIIIEKWNSWRFDQVRRLNEQLANLRVEREMAARNARRELSVQKSVEELVDRARVESRRRIEKKRLESLSLDVKLARQAITAPDG